MVVPTLQSPIGSVIGGRYRVLSVLGEGGMGVLYAAEHTLTRRRVALKLLRSGRDGDELRTLRERFLVEARTAAAVRHPNIVDVLDMGLDEDGSPFLALELLEGMALDQMLRERGQLSPEQTLRFLLPIIGALATLHDAGIVHRDIKPSNIFLRTGARLALEPKLLDFGLAHPLADPRLTRSGMVVGTPLYIAPEQAAGDAVGFGADVWSVGVVLYECLAGRVPFKGEERAALAAQVLAGQIQPLREVAPHVAPSFAYAIERALRRDLRMRYTSMRELARSLVASAHGSGIALPPDPDPVGLPDFHAWSTVDASVAHTVSVESPAAPAALRTSPVSTTSETREGGVLATTPKSALKASAPNGKRARAVWLLSGFAFALVLLGASWALGGRGETSPPAAGVEAVPAALPRAAPAALPLVPRAMEPAHADAEAPKAGLSTPAPMQTAPAPSTAPEAPARRVRSKRATRRQQPSASTPERTTDAPSTANADAAPNPFHVEADWR